MTTIERTYRPGKILVEKYFGVLNGGVHKVRKRLRKIREETSENVNKSLERIRDLRMKLF